MITTMIKARIGTTISIIVVVLIFDEVAVGNGVVAGVAEVLAIEGFGEVELV